MASPYQVGVDISLATNAPQMLALMSQHLLGVQGAVGQLTAGFANLRMGIIGAVGVLTGKALLGGMGHIIDRGNALIKIQRDMAQAGATNVQVQEAYARAWELTGKYSNVGTVEVLRMMNDARMIFGSVEHGIENIEPFVRASSFLKAFEGNEKGGAHSEQLLREINAAMKSGEIAGKITPVDMAAHVSMLAAMKVAFGEQVKITQYLTAQRTAGVAMRNTDDAFRYGVFPALVQENGVNAGTMLMTLFNKVVAGVGNRTLSIQRMAELGLLDHGKVKYDKVGRAIGITDAGAIKGSDLAARNPAEWVWTVLKPLIDKQTQGLTGVAKSIRESQIISGFLPDRNAAKAVTELLQQETKLRKDAAMLTQARKAQDMRGYTEGSWDYQVQAFHTQWVNFLEAFGAPMVAKATRALAGLNSVLSSMAKWMSENPETAKVIGTVLTGVGAGLVAIGVALVGGAILAAIGGGGWLIAGFVALAGVITALYSPVRWLLGLADEDGSAKRAHSFVQRLLKKNQGYNEDDMLGGEPTPWGGLEKQSYGGVGAIPPKSNVIPIRNDITLNVDGRVLARVVTENQAKAAMFQTSVGGQDTRGMWLSPGAMVSA